MPDKNFGDGVMLAILYFLPYDMPTSYQFQAYGQVVGKIEVKTSSFMSSFSRVSSACIQGL